MPVRGEHAPDYKVYPAVVYPLGFAHDAFAGEAQPLRNRAASLVAGAALNGDAMQGEVIEQVIDQGRAAFRHQAAALPIRIDPIADAAMLVGPIDRMAADRTGDPAIDNDRGLRPLIGFVLI